MNTNEHLYENLYWKSMNICTSKDIDILYFYLSQLRPSKLFCTATFACHLLHLLLVINDWDGQRHLILTSPESDLEGSVGTREFHVEWVKKSKKCRFSGFRKGMNHYESYILVLSSTFCMLGSYFELGLLWGFLRLVCCRHEISTTLATTRVLFDDNFHVEFFSRPQTRRLLDIQWAIDYTDYAEYTQLGRRRKCTRAARGGGGSFKNRKRIGKIRCCESQLSERKHSPIVQRSNSLTISELVS